MGRLADCCSFSSSFMGFLCGKIPQQTHIIITVSVPQKPNVGDTEYFSGIISSIEKWWIVLQATRQVLIPQLHFGAEQCRNLICDTKINLLGGPLAAYFIKVLIRSKWVGDTCFAEVIGIEQLAKGNVSKKKISCPLCIFIKPL